MYDDLSAALKIKLNFFQEMGRLLRISLGFLTFFFSFYAIDDVVFENGNPIGLALAMVFCTVWVLASGSFFFCAERVKNSSPETQAAYWVFWTQLLLSTVVVFSIGFIPSLSAYYKSLIAAPLLLLVLCLHKSYHKPLEYTRKRK